MRDISGCSAVWWEATCRASGVRRLLHKFSWHRNCQTKFVRTEQRGGASSQGNPGSTSSSLGGDKREIEKNQSRCEIDTGPGLVLGKGKGGSKYLQGQSKAKKESRSLAMGP